MLKFDLWNYATKTDLENVTHIDTSCFALKTNLVGLKTEVDELDIDKLVLMWVNSVMLLKMMLLKKLFMMN